MAVEYDQVVQVEEVQISSDRDSEKVREQKAQPHEPTKSALKPGIKKRLYALYASAQGNYEAPGAVTGWIQEHTTFPYNDYVKALQFSGKAHEFLLVSALSAVVLHFTRKKLLSEGGLPFGMLSSGNRQWDYFLTHSFRRSIFSDKYFALFLVLCAILGMTVGPSSNNLLQPSLDWWKIPDSFGGNPLPVYIGAPVDRLYPNYVGPDYLTNQSCGLVDSRHSSPNCPSGGYQTIYLWTVDLGQTGIGGNVSMLEYHSNSLRSIISDTGIAASTQNGIAFATTLAEPIVQAIGLFSISVQQHIFGISSQVARGKFTPSGDLPISAPFVTISCNMYDYQTAIGADGEQLGNEPIFPFPESINSQLAASNPQADGLAVPQKYWNFTHPLDVVNFTWVDTWNTFNASSRTSIGALFTIPWIHRDYSPGTTTVSNATQRSWIIPCSVDARWAAVSVFNDPAGGSGVSTNLTDPASLQGTPTDSLSEMFGIDTQWAESLDGWTYAWADNSFKSGNFSAISALMRIFISPNNTGSPIFFNPPTAQHTTDEEIATGTLNTISKVLGTYMADGLARLNNNRNILVLIGEDTTTPSAEVNVTSLLSQVNMGVFNKEYTVAYWDNYTKTDWASLTFNMERYGYGWGVTTKITIVAVVVLSIHAAVILAFLVYIILTPWATSAWDDISDFLALAINSTPTDELAGTCAGVQEVRTFQSRVRIREFPIGSNHLELVVTGDLGDVVPGAVPVVKKRYGIRKEMRGE